MLSEHRARFENIYNEYSGLILAYAARRTSSAEDAADVVAETFAVAWRRFDKVPRGEEARPWLYAVARRVLANQARGARRRTWLNDRVIAEFARSLSYSDQTGDGGETARISAAFTALSDADRELLTLVGWDDLDREDIATVLGCSVATVRVRLHRARSRFESSLLAQGMKRDEVTGHGSKRGATALRDPEDAS